jgi:IS1 family transposase
MKRVCEKDPMLCQPKKIVVIDTIVYTDTLEFYEEYFTDVHDTIVIDTGSVTVKIIREHDIIKTYIKQRPDTIRITKSVTMPPQIVYTESWFKWWYLLIIFAIFALIIKIK